MSIERYDCNSEMYQSHYGSFVRFDDHEAELAALRIENDTLRAELESAHAAQLHAEKELAQYMAWYAMAEHQHLHEQRRAEKAEAERDALRAAVEEIEERTRPNGDMADLAVNLVARATLGESDEM